MGLEKCEKQKNIYFEEKKSLSIKITEITNKYEETKILLNTCTSKRKHCDEKSHDDEKKCREEKESISKENREFKISIQRFEIQINKCNEASKVQEKCCKDCQSKNEDCQTAEKHLFMCKIREGDCLRDIRSRDTKIEELLNIIIQKDKQIVSINYDKTQITQTTTLTINQCQNSSKGYKERIYILEGQLRECENTNKYLYEFKERYLLLKKECDRTDRIIDKREKKHLEEIKVCKEKLKECNGNYHKCTKDLNLYITINMKEKEQERQTCEEKRKHCDNELIKKTVYIENYITMIKKKIVTITNELNLKCEKEKEAFRLEIIELKKQLEDCNKNGSNETKIKIQNYITQIEELNIQIKEINVTIINLQKKNKECGDELEKGKTSITQYQSQISTISIQINKSGEKCDKRYDELLKKYEIVYQLSEDYKLKLSFLNIKLEGVSNELDICKKKKCETCENKLKICTDKETTIINNYQTKIDIKVTEIKELTIIIGDLRKKCDQISKEDDNKVQEYNDKIVSITEQYESCSFNLKIQMNLTKTCKHERDHCKREFEECTRIQSCKHDEIEMYKRDADKCHEHKKEYQVEITSLQDKVRKTHTERSTFIRESHTEIERVTKNCDVDSTVMNEFMNKFQTSLIELNKVKDSIYRDSSVDQFDLSKQTEIQMKTEEIKRYEIKITQSTDEV